MRFLRPKEHEAYILLKTKKKSYLRGFQLRLENETKVVTLTQDAGKLVHASYDWL